MRKWVLIGGVWLWGLALAQAAESIIYVDGYAVDTLEEPAEGMFEYDALELDQPLQFDPRPSRSPAEGLGSVKQNTPTLSDYIRLSQQYANAKNWPEALRSISEAIKKSPNRMDLRRKAAVYASLSGVYSIAEKNFQIVLNDSPDEPMMQGGYAAVLIRNQKFSDAVDILSGVKEENQKLLLIRFNWACLEAIGEVQGKSEQWKENSVGDLIQVVNWLDADQVALRTALGNEGYEALMTRTTGWADPVWVDRGRRSLQGMSSLYALGKWEEAYQSLKELVNAGGDVMGLVMEYARSGFFAGHVEESFSIMEGLRTSFPGNFFISYNYSYLLMQAARYAEAVTVLENLRENSTEGGLDVRFALAGAYAGEGEMDKVWPILESILNEQPRRLPSLLEGETEYLVAIRSDERYADFLKRLNSVLIGQ